MPTHVRSSGALTTVIIGSLLLSFGLAGPAIADDYPTWDEVLAARENVEQTAAAIDEIEGILTALENEAAALGRVAQQRGEQYNAAKLAYDTAADKADTLEEQADAAAERATQSQGRAAALIAQLARTGGGSLTIELLLSDHAEDLLSGLGTASKLTERSTLIYRQAIQDRNNAQSLTDQAVVAEQRRDALADEAQAALDEAKAASDDAEARLAEQQQASDQLYAQLATLKGTTAALEQQYQEGLTQEQEEAEQPPAPAPSTPSNPAPTPPNPTPPAPNSSAVQGAIAFARAQIGDRYQFAGSGPDAWDCSGLTKAAYASVGVYIGAHIVSSQYYTMKNAGRLVPIGQMVAGDLIYYANGGSTSGGFYHVAMYVGGGQMIEAPRPGVPVRITAVRYYDALPYAGRPTP